MSSKPASATVEDKMRKTTIIKKKERERKEGERRGREGGRQWTFLELRTTCFYLNVYFYFSIMYMPVSMSRYMHMTLGA